MHQKYVERNGIIEMRMYRKREEVQAAKINKQINKEIKSDEWVSEWMKKSKYIYTGKVNFQLCLKNGKKDEKKEQRGSV